MPLATIGHRNATSSSLLTDWLLDASRTIVERPNVTNRYYLEKRYHVMKLLKIVSERVREQLYVTLCDSMYVILGVVHRDCISKLERKHRCRITQLMNHSELIINDGYFEMWTNLRVYQEGFGRILEDLGVGNYSCRVIVLNILDCDVIERESNVMELNTIPLLYDQFRYKQMFARIDSDDEEGEADDVELEGDNAMDPF